MKTTGTVNHRLFPTVVLALLATAACQERKPSSGANSATVEGARAELNLSTTLAHPEYDLNEPAGWWWMHSADATIVSNKLTEGYRLISLDVLTPSPLIFTATFVYNSGYYQRAGNAWLPDVSEAELLTIRADTTRRIVDIAPYIVGGVRHYGVVWIAADGKQYDIFLHRTQADLASDVAAFNGRVMDIDAEPDGAGGFDLSGVMIKNTGEDQRAQTFGVASGPDVFAVTHDSGETPQKRLLDLEPVGSGQFFYVVEDYAVGQSGERAWWTGDMFYDGIDSFDNVDSIAHAPKRFGGRFAKLKGYDSGAGTRYFGMLVDNRRDADVPKHGTNDVNCAVDLIDAAAINRLKTIGTPGLLLAVVDKGNLVLARGYGYSDLQHDREMQATDSLRLASVSKTIGLSAVLRTIENGSTLPGSAPKAGQPLTLDTHPWGDLWQYPPAGQPAPTWSPNLGDVTVRHLLEHSVGADGSFEWLATPDDYVFNERCLQTCPRPAGCQDAGAAVCTIIPPFRHQPGIIDPVNPGNFYKNSDYHMLGHVVSDVNGTTYESFVRTTFFTPLSLTRIGVSHATDPTGALDPPGLFQALNYDRIGFERKHFGDQDPSVRGDWVLTPIDRYPASSYGASPIELLRWATSLDGSRGGPRGLNDASYLSIRTGISPALVGSGRWLGFFGSDGPNPPVTTLLNHNGYLPGVTNSFLVIRGDGIKFAFAASSEMPFGALYNDLMAIFDSFSQTGATCTGLPKTDHFGDYLPEPIARCKDVTVNAGPSCTANVTPAMVDNGSTAPAGTSLSLSLSPSGPFHAGPPTTVTLSASDGKTTSTCTAQVTVNDVTPPVLVAPGSVSTVSCAAFNAVTVGTATVTDNCATPTPIGQVITSNGVTLTTPIPVVSGQVTLGPGTHVIQWTATDGTNAAVPVNQTVTIKPTIETSLSFAVDDRAVVRLPGGTPAGVVNAGAGPTVVSYDAHAGGVLSVGAVTIRDRAVVGPGVTSAATVSASSSATVSGTITQNAQVALPALPTLPSFPAPTGGAVTVNPGTPRTLAPGSYSTVIVNSGATLILQAGTYYMQSLTINSSSVVRATATTKIYVRDTLAFRAPILAATGSAIQPVLLGFAGSTVSFEAVFNGTFIAPNATAQFGTGSGLTYTGGFYARTIEVRAQSVLVCQTSNASP